MSIENYRTPDELAEDRRAADYVSGVIDNAVNNAASMWAAMYCGESEDVFEMWCNKLWNELRDSLDEEQRLDAIMFLIRFRVHAAAKRLVKADGHG